MTKAEMMEAIVAAARAYAFQHEALWKFEMKYARERDAYKGKIPKWREAELEKAREAIGELYDATHEQLLDATEEFENVLFASDAASP